MPVEIYDTANPDCSVDRHQGTVQPAVATVRVDGVPLCMYHYLGTLPRIAG